MHSAAIAKLQCLTAGLFIYMGFFELMPPLPHSRLASLKHFIVFILGLATAFRGGDDARALLISAGQPLRSSGQSAAVCDEFD